MIGRRAEGRFRELQLPKHVEDTVHPSEYLRSHLPRSAVSLLAQWNLALLPQLLMVVLFLLFTPTPPLFLFCSISFLYYAGIILVIVGGKRHSISMCHPVVVWVSKGSMSCDN